MLVFLFKSYRRKIFPNRPENFSGLMGIFFRSGEKRTHRKIFPVRQLFPVSGQSRIFGVKIILNRAGNVKPIRAVESGALGFDQASFSQRIDAAANRALRASHGGGKVFLFKDAVNVIGLFQSVISGEFPRVQVRKLDQPRTKKFLRGIHINGFPRQLEAVI